MLAVGGSCGDAAGFNMIAGTILVFGSCGDSAGAGMRRGTIGLFGADPPQAAADVPTGRPRSGRFFSGCSSASWRGWASRSTRAARRRAVALPR